MNSQGRKRIALIYEGVKAEEELLNNMKQTFLSEFSEVDTFHLPARWKYIYVMEADGRR